MEDHDWGYEPGDVAKFRERYGDEGWLMQEMDEDRQAAFFYCMLPWQGADHVADVSLTTLRYEHAAQVYEKAVEAATDLARQLYGWENLEDLGEDEQAQLGELLEDCLDEAEQEGEVKVTEELVLEAFSEHGLLVEAAWHVEELSEERIAEFVSMLRQGAFQPSKKVFTFQEQDEQ